MVKIITIKDNYLKEACLNKINIVGLKTLVHLAQNRLSQSILTAEYCVYVGNAVI